MAEPGNVPVSPCMPGRMKYTRYRAYRGEFTSRNPECTTITPSNGCTSRSGEMGLKHTQKITDTGGDLPPEIEKMDNNQTQKLADTGGDLYPKMEEKWTSKEHSFGIQKNWKKPGRFLS